ncbi:hypothetical protein [Pacificoceanicola onchidii]|nr:hypothetical protein [Pacificoceanicola onchidii]
MKSQRRFIKSIIETAKQEHPPMPWQRGVVRKATIEKRAAPLPQLKRA